ncbi:MAG: hypothetical protein LAO05_16275 [Acidobacteriia bacterium]|nr:hypothetical protein [Terriglobia bacterium]
MRLVRVILEWVRFATAALAVSTFPERAKRTGWPSFYASVAAHIVSGWIETLLSATLFIMGFLRFGERFNHGAGWTYVSHKPSLTYGDFFGVGIIGYLSYLLTPFAWITVWCFGEGIVRALDAALSSRMLGMALVVLPWRAAGAIERAQARRTLLAKLGPERPDEVADGGPGSAVALVVFASREKPWAGNQVIEYRREFFRAVGKRLERRGDHFAFRYDFCRLDHGEVIRGVLERYEPDKVPARAADPAGTDAPEVTGVKH